jgi:hypothetical protein
MENEKIKLTKNQKSNKKLAIRRKQKHLNILHLFKLKKDNIRKLVIEDTVYGQSIKSYDSEIINEYRIKINKEKILLANKIIKLNRMDLIEELKLIHSYDNIKLNEINYLNNANNCILS